MMAEVLAVILLTVANTQVSGYWLHMLIPVATYAIGYVLRRKEMLDALNTMVKFRNSCVGQVSDEELRGMDMVIANYISYIDDQVEAMAEDYDDGDQAG